MKIVVVYKSMFGSTKSIAEAIAERLGDDGELKIGTVDDLAPDETHDAASTVAGGPSRELLDVR